VVVDLVGVFEEGELGFEGGGALVQVDVGAGQSFLDLAF
jgi:hypothetical protein